MQILDHSREISGSGSIVGIATGWAGRSRDRILVGARFSTPVQTSPGSHPASCMKGTGSLPRGKEWPGRDADPSPPSSAVVKERVELYLYPPMTVWPVQSLSAYTRGALYLYTLEK